MIKHTVKDIRAELNDERQRLYIKTANDVYGRRIFNVRTAKGRLQVKLAPVVGSPWISVRDNHLIYSQR